MKLLKKAWKALKEYWKNLKKGNNGGIPSSGHTKSGLRSTLLSILTIVIGLVLVPFLMNLISRIITWSFALPVDDDHSFFLFSEAAVGVIAALLVVHQLRKETEAEASETLLQQSAFIKDFNQTFLTGGFTDVESDLEKYLNCPNASEMSLGEPGDDARQHYINYLVYLESLATVIQNGAMTIDNVDCLMGYRFFIAANNPVVQKKELIPYAYYYRGIFKLYEEWVVKKYEQCRDAAREAEEAFRELGKGRGAGAGSKTTGAEKTSPKAKETSSEAAESVSTAAENLSIIHDSLPEDPSDLLPGALRIAAEQVNAMIEKNTFKNLVQAATQSASGRRHFLPKQFRPKEKSAEEKALFAYTKLNCLSELLPWNGDSEVSWFGIPMFNEENALCRPGERDSGRPGGEGKKVDYKLIYEVALGMPSKVPPILKAMKPKCNESSAAS